MLVDKVLRTEDSESLLRAEFPQLKEWSPEEFKFEVKHGLLIYYRLEVSYQVCLWYQSWVPIVWNTRETGNRHTTWLRVSSSSASSGFLLLFFKRWSQYLARSSGDLLLVFALRVTELLLMNLPQALSREATKPLSLEKAVNTRALYFLCTSKMVLTYSCGSWNKKINISLRFWIATGILQYSGDLNTNHMNAIVSWLVNYN